MDLPSAAQPRKAFKDVIMPHRSAPAMLDSPELGVIRKTNSSHPLAIDGEAPAEEKP